jgi:hypothetical protein
VDKRHFIFEEYLKAPNTNYACIINGDWGAGKTFWLKTKIKPLIEETETIEDSRIKYKYVYISLYGVNSVKELQNIIFFEFYYLLKKSKLKAAFDVTKIVGEAYLKFNGLNGIDKLFTTIESQAKKYVSLNKLMICFDDIERKGTKLDINDLAGFINNLTENQNAKVLLLLNDKKIEDKESIRGKLDGISITYNPVILNVINDIISKNYQAFPGYSKFLRKNISVLTDLYDAGLNNLRYFIYGINKFQKVFSLITNTFVGEKLNKYNTDIILKDCFRFSIAIAYEFKEGKSAEYLIYELSLASLARTERLMQQLRNKTQNEEKEKSYREVFYGKYLYKESYDYLNSLAQYILGYEDFNILNFENELQNFKKYVKAILTDDEQLYLDLHYQHCFTFTDAEYLVKINQLYAKGKNGIYPLYNYPSIFHFITRFDNPLNLDKDILMKELKGGINKYIKTAPTFNRFLDKHFGFSSADPDVKYLSEIAEYALKTNRNLLSNDETKHSEELFLSFKRDPEKFIEDYLSDEKKSKHYISIFIRFNANETAQSLYKSKNQCIHDFAILIEYRYKHYFEGHKDDLDFLTKLKDSNISLGFVDLPVKKSQFEFLNEKLENSITNLNNGKK